MRVRGVGVYKPCKQPIYEPRTPGLSRFLMVDRCKMLYADSVCNGATIYDGDLLLQYSYESSTTTLSVTKSLVEGKITEI